MAEKCAPICDMKAGLLDCIDAALSVRDCLGVALAEVSIITRVWTGKRVGDGTYTETVQEVRPTPGIRNFSHDIRISEAGAVKQGDLMLIGISKNGIPLESTLKTQTNIKNTEKMILVGKHYYRTISIVEHLLTWDIQVRKITKDENEK